MIHITKNDIIEVVAKKTNLTSKATRDVVQTFLSTVQDSLKRGEKVVLTGFGTFSLRPKKARPGRNPKTGERIQLPARKTPGFTAGKSFKRSIK